MHAEDHDRLNRSVCGAEPVRRPRAEFDGLARIDDEIALTQYQPHTTGEHIRPVLPFVNGQLGGRLSAFGGDSDLECVQSACGCLAGERPVGDVVVRVRTAPNPRIGSLRRAQQFVGTRRSC